MKKAVVIVDRCRRCPHGFISPDHLEFACRGLDKPVDPDTIPADCPLEEAGEEE